MSKTLLTLLILMMITGAVKAQQINYKPGAANPFTGLPFTRSYKDTITLKAVYSGESGKASASNLITLNQLNKLYGVKIGKFQNSLGFNFEGAKQKFYVPYNAENTTTVASAKPNTLLMLKCTVYRFFTIDGIANFFYVDKILKAL